MRTGSFRSVSIKDDVSKLSEKELSALFNIQTASSRTLDVVWSSVQSALQPSPPSQSSTPVSITPSPQVFSEQSFLHASLFSWLPSSHASVPAVVASPQKFKQDATLAIS